jgi:uncharacterized protein with GYD domain
MCPKFLFEASYTLDGIKGVQRAGGSSRRDAVAQVAESVGGRLESFHFAFGERDAFVIVDLPDNESATAVALTVNVWRGDRQARGAPDAGGGRGGREAILDGRTRRSRRPCGPHAHAASKR